MFLCATRLNSAHERSSVWSLEQHQVELSYYFWWLYDTHAPNANDYANWVKLTCSLSLPHADVEVLLAVKWKWRDVHELMLMLWKCDAKLLLKFPSYVLESHIHVRESWKLEEATQLQGGKRLECVVVQSGSCFWRWKLFGGNGKLNTTAQSTSYTSWAKGNDENVSLGSFSLSHNTQTLHKIV